MERPEKTDVFISRVDGIWSAFLQKKNDIVLRAKEKDILIDFITKVNDDLLDLGINPRFHCVENYGINEKSKQADEVKIQVHKFFGMDR